MQRTSSGWRNTAFILKFSKPPRASFNFLTALNAWSKSSEHRYWGDFILRPIQNQEGTWTVIVNPRSFFVNPCCGSTSSRACWTRVHTSSCSCSCLDPTCFALTLPRAAHGGCLHVGPFVGVVGCCEKGGCSLPTPHPGGAWRYTPNPPPRSGSVQCRRGTAPV